MDQVDKEDIAKLIREGRAAKGYTQQELSDLAGLSLRSVQRIENAEVIPRTYTLRTLFEKLEIARPLPAPAAAIPTPATQPSSNLNRPRKLILTISAALLILLATAAFIAYPAASPKPTSNVSCSPSPQSWFTRLFYIVSGNNPIIPYFRRPPSAFTPYYFV